MTKLDVLKSAGLFNGCSAQEAANRLVGALGCPPDIECPNDKSCWECWRKWLREEVELRIDQGGQGT